MAEEKCRFFESELIPPGWGCCRCNVYNYAAKEICVNCKHHICITLPAEKVAESAAELIKQ